MTKIAILFPGQGSQTPGMGKSLYYHNQRFRERFDLVDQHLNINLKSLCFESDPRIEETQYSQLAIVSVSSLIAELVLDKGSMNQIYLLGHSLGEYSALYSAGVFSLEDMLKLVKTRGTITGDVATAVPSGMAAVLGGDEDKTEALCANLRQIGHRVEIANYNLPNQTVISGTLTGLEEFRLRMAETKARRFMQLKVSGAFHSSLMQEASERFLPFLKTTPRNKPLYHVMMNYDGKSLEIGKLDECLSKQLCHPIRFYPIIQSLYDAGVSTFIEIGPGTVLTNLVRKILPSVIAMSVNSEEDLNLMEVLL